MPVPNALRGSSSSSNSQFLSSNPHFIGRGGRVLGSGSGGGSGSNAGGGGGGGSRVDSVKFSNYLKTIDSQPP